MVLSTMGEATQYTWAEVAPHTGRGGARLRAAYKNDVLDLTEFQHEHPGGDELLLQEGGGDCTREFDDAGHSGDAKLIMRKYKVGEIVQEQRRYDANGKRLKTPGGAGAGGEGGGGEGGRSCLNMVTCGLLG